MNPFHRLFGKKPKNQDSNIPEQTQEVQSEQESISPSPPKEETQLNFPSH